MLKMDGIEMDTPTGTPKAARRYRLAYTMPDHEMAEWPDGKERRESAMSRAGARQCDTSPSAPELIEAWYLARSPLAIASRYPL